MEVFVARQPIFDKDLKVFAYELLFRKNSNNYYDNLDEDQATLSVITNSFMVIGMGSLTGGKKAFINFTKTLLKREVASTLPKEQLVVEILENVEPDDEIIDACRKLKERGYLLVLDDFVFQPEFKPLIDIADIIKIDFRITTGSERKKVIDKINNKKIKFLAEKVESREEFEEALSYGYEYFQGYFFSKPVILSAKEIPSYKLHYINLIAEIGNSKIDLDKIEDIIKRDVSLSYKLLRFINTAAFGFKTQVNSIKHALVLLGEKEVVKWIYLIALNDLGNDKPNELVLTSIIRARLGELLAPKLGMKNREADFFFMGMLSMIDTFIDLPLNEILPQIPISDEIKEALMGGSNFFGKVYALIIAYERGDWNKFSRMARILDLDESQIPNLYVESLEWADELFRI